MNTKLILSATAIAMGAAGVAGTFLPHELLTAFGIAAVGMTPLLIQILAALLFAFAMVNWMARGSLIGGIYNRPIAVGNLTHFVIGALALAKAVLNGARSPLLVTITLVYVLFAIAFTSVLMRSPAQGQR